MPNNHVEFGWGADPISVQHPCIPQADASHFDEDSRSISRLFLRGLITPSQRDAAIKKLTKRIEASIKQALSTRRDGLVLREGVAS
jgi:hypothetical protein